MDACSDATHMPSTKGKEMGMNQAWSKSTDYITILLIIAFLSARVTESPELYSHFKTPRVSKGPSDVLPGLKGKFGNTPLNLA